MAKKNVSETMNESANANYPLAGIKRVSNEAKTTKSTASVSEDEDKDLAKIPDEFRALINQGVLTKKQFTNVRIMCQNKDLIKTFVFNVNIGDREAIAKAFGVPVTGDRHTDCMALWQTIYENRHRVNPDYKPFRVNPFDDVA